MKIKKVDIYKLDAGNERAARQPVVCRIWTDEGIYGDGEAGLAYESGYTGCVGMLQDLAPRIIGKDPMANDAIFDLIRKNTFWGQSTGPVMNASMSAIDIALMDIKGKALGVPCYQLLGGKFRGELRCYASQLQQGWEGMPGKNGTPEEYVNVVKHAMSQGYDAVKIDFTQVGRDRKNFPVDRCVGILSQNVLAMVEERMAAIREAVGYDLDIIVENHCRTDYNSALQIGRLCDKYKIFAYEEPVSLLNPEMMADLSKRLETPLASGERLYTRWGFYNYLKDRSIQLIQPDVCNAGGLAETKKICDMSEIFDCVVQAHVAGSPISSAASLHLEAAIPNFCIHEHHYRSTSTGITDLCIHNYQPVNGKFVVPELPGLGQELSEKAMDTALMHVSVT